MGSVALVFAGGDSPPPDAFVGLPGADLVIAADSGLQHAEAHGYRVDLVVGDLDSVDPAALEAARARGAAVEQHPVEKDATDLELALLAARDRDFTQVVVIGGHGGRIDHFLGNALLLASPELSGLEIDARVADARILVVRSWREIHGAPGDLCSLLPVGGAVFGVRTEGMRYPLRSETLPLGSTRGISNVLETGTASVALAEGILLVVVVHAEQPDQPDQAEHGEAAR